MEQDKQIIDIIGSLKLLMNDILGLFQPIIDYINDFNYTGVLNAFMAFGVLVLIEMIRSFMSDKPEPLD